MMKILAFLVVVGFSLNSVQSCSFCVSGPAITEPKTGDTRKIGKVPVKWTAGNFLTFSYKIEITKSTGTAADNGAGVTDHASEKDKEKENGGKDGAEAGEATKRRIPAKHRDGPAPADSTDAAKPGAAAAPEVIDAGKETSKEVDMNTAGEYSIRVGAASMIGGPKYGPPVTITITAEGGEPGNPDAQDGGEAPKIVKPTPGQIVEAGADLMVEWKKVKDTSLAYKVLIEYTSKPEDYQKEEEVGKSDISDDDDSPSKMIKVGPLVGKYTVKVKTVGSGGNTGTESQVEIEVKPKAAIAAPKITKPQKDAKLKSGINQVEWEKADGAVKYRIKMKKPKHPTLNSDDVVVETKDNDELKQDLSLGPMPGKYTIQVAGMDDKDLVGEWGEVQVDVSVEKAPTPTITTADKTKLTADQKIEWKMPAATGSGPAPPKPDEFNIEYAPTAELTKIEKATVDGAVMEYAFKSGTKSGEYQFKVAAVGVSGVKDTISDWAKITVTVP